MNIDQILNNIYPLTNNSIVAVKEYITETNYPKGYILLRANKVEKSIYFIKKRIVRAYSNLAENEITFWFGKEGDTVISMKSYVANQKGYENIQLLEDCQLYELKIKDLQDFLTKTYRLRIGVEDLPSRNLSKQKSDLSLNNSEPPPSAIKKF